MPFLGSLHPPPQHTNRQINAKTNQQRFSDLAFIKTLPRFSKTLPKLSSIFDQSWSWPFQCKFEYITSRLSQYIFYLQLLNNLYDRRNYVRLVAINKICIEQSCAANFTFWQSTGVELLVSVQKLHLKHRSKIIPFSLDAIHLTFKPDWVVNEVDEPETFNVSSLLPSTPARICLRALQKCII